MESIQRKPVPAPAVQSLEEPTAAEGERAFAKSEGEPSTNQGGDTPSLQRQSKENLKQRLDARIDRFLPPHRRYCGLSRRLACLVSTGILLILLALILGLAIGLSLRNGCVIWYDRLSWSNGADDSLRTQHLALPLGSQTYTGDLTYYGTGLSACGIVAHDSDDIVSISHYIFDAVSTSSNPNANPLCGHKLRAVREGNSVDLTVVDRCMPL